MAPVGEKNDRMNSVTEDPDNDSQNLWNSILTEVQSSSASKLPTSKSVIVLGDNESGKTTLIAKLQGVEEPKKGIGLEYYYLNVKDEYRDDQGRLGMWALDGDTMHTSLLKYALTEETFENTLVLLVASMTSPWSILDTLEKWASILRHHIDRLRISPEDRRDYDQSLVRFYQEYVEPDESTSVTQTSMRRDVNPLHPAAPAVAEEDKVLLPLGENILAQNLGIPIIVVLTKADAISTLEKENDYKEEHFDFIQMHIRNFCLHYGASLFYTSVKEEKNCDLLHQYLLHRIYGFPFNMPAFVVEKDSVFIPAGWDNDKKIAILHENLQNIKPTDAYEDVIAKPIVRKPVQRDAEVTVEDVQLFLMKQQSHLSKAPSPGAAGESPVRTGSQTPKTATIGKAASSPTPTTVSPNKKMENKAGAGGAATSEGMLANFFNSLLNKKSGAPGTPRPDTAGVHAELEKMTKTTAKTTRKAHSDANPNGPTAS
ncbi:cytoplasmic dynein 1 light intermediate chain 2-like [Mya arenaria]|uniref:cytoplasmic dynein 1 light intermediate chain 2-like n=1 Tax=Mya arenaria TaxID=6604 RepID=UPI0022E02486|nr:cytoplasmic dynein 1 light intermediate chain 2-like [Mya arenaria]XP_052819306.1 cytoplasmic dynein 1 light intermediate chain 2-like [Mya arenaria]